MQESIVPPGGAAGRPFSPTGDPLPLFRILIPTVIAVTIAWGAMKVGYSLPGRDVVDDVGLSLMVGYEDYSEATEQRAFLAFVATAFVLSTIVAMCVSRCSVAFTRILGEATAWGVLVALLWSCREYLSPREVATIGLLTAIAGGTGFIAGRLGLDRDKWGLLSWAITVIVFVVTLDSGRFVILELSQSSANAFGVVFAALGIVGWIAPGKLRAVWPLIMAATYVAMVTIIGVRNGFADAAIMTFVSLVFLETGTSDRRADWKNYLKRQFQVLLNHPWWFGLTVCVLWIELGSMMIIGMLAWDDLCVLSIQGMLAGVLLQGGRHKLPSVDYHFLCSTLDRFSRQSWALPLMIFVASATRGWGGLWFGTCLAIATSFLTRSNSFGESMTFRTRLCVVGLFAAASLPDVDAWMKSLDAFHDGQILSAIWEFDQGEKLYSRVFPLRGAKFFMGWLSRRVFPDTLDGTYVLESFSNTATAVGACLIAYAWTRSTLWSLAIGLLVQPGGELEIATRRSPLWWAVTGLQVPSFSDGREGLMLLLAGIACLLFRCRHGYWGLVLLSLPAMHSGFDIMTPFLGGVAASIVWRHVRRGDVLSWGRGGVRSVGFVAASVGLFSGSLALFQGQESVRAFWRIFIDYCKHFSSFAGLPLKFDHLILVELTGLAAFTAVGAASWNRMPRRKRQLWVFLTVVSSLCWFRALGRSDYGHVTGPLHLFHLLWTLVAVDAICHFSRSGLSFTRRDSEYLAALSLTVLAASVGDTSNPWRFCSQLARIYSDHRTVGVADPALNQLVATTEYLWATEDGLANYLQRRHNPTRHAQMLCISSPNEQRSAVQDMMARPPAVVLWRWTPVDKIHPLTRQYIVANWVLRHFRPGDDSTASFGLYAVPAEPDWPALDRLPEGFATPQQLCRLPDVWGEFRWPRLAERIVARRFIGPDDVVADSVSRNQCNVDWRLAENFSPRQFNYLLVEFGVRFNDQTAITKVLERPTAILNFSTGEDFDSSSECSWECAMDGRRRRYLVPIGCHPYWTWRSSIRRLRLHVPGNCSVFELSIIACEIDELRTYDK